MFYFYKDEDGLEHQYFSLTSPKAKSENLLSTDHDVPVRVVEKDRPYAPRVASLVTPFEPFYHNPNYKKTDTIPGTSFCYPQVQSIVLQHTTFIHIIIIIIKTKQTHDDLPEELPGKRLRSRP
jgi:hypothetical protein